MKHVIVSSVNASSERMLVMERMKVASPCAIFPNSGKQICNLATNCLSSFSRFQDKLSVNITDSQVQAVSLVAYGSGTTIVSEPPLAPAVKLGPQFSCQPVRKWFKLTNSGRRPQQIYWTTEGFLPHRTRKKIEYNPDDMRYQVWKLKSYFPYMEKIIISKPKT